MKKIIIATALLLGCTVFAGDLLVDVKNHTSSNIRHRRVTITLLEPGPVVAGPWLIAGDAVAQLTGTDGTTTFSNLLAGAYRLDIAGVPGRSFPFSMPDTNGTVNVSALIGATNVNPIFYTSAQIDALLDAFAIIPGDNISVATNGRAWTITGEAGGEGGITEEDGTNIATTVATTIASNATNPIPSWIIHPAAGLGLEAVTNSNVVTIGADTNVLATRAYADTIDPSYWINVKNFGAVGDGVTDDTDAITAAYEVFNDEAEHRVLYFPAGKYLDYGQRYIGAAAAESPVHTRATRSVIGDGERSVILAWGTNGPYISTTNRAVYIHDFILSGPQSTNSSTPLSVVSGKSSGIALFGSDARPVLSRLTVQWFPRYGIFMESHRGPILHDVWAHGNKVGIGIGRGTHGLDASVRFSLCSIGMEFGAQSSNVVDNLPSLVSDGPGGNRVHFSSYGCDIGILMDYPAPGTKFSGTFVSIGHEPFLFGRYSRSLWRPGTSTIDSDWTIPPTSSSAETMEVAVDALYVAATPGTASNVFNVRVPTKLTISNSRFNHTAPTPFLRVYSSAGGSVVYRQNVTVSSNNFVGDASYTLFDYGDARGWTNFYSTNLVGSYVGSPLTLTSERLLGRNTASAGPVEEISIGTGLELSGGVLSATGEGGEATNVLHLAASDSIGITTNDLLRTPFLTEAMTNYFVGVVNSASNALLADLAPLTATNDSRAVDLHGVFTGDGSGLTNLAGGDGDSYWGSPSANNIGTTNGVTITGTLTNYGTFHFTNSSGANQFVNFNGSTFRVNQSFAIDASGNAYGPNFLGIISPGSGSGGAINGGNVTSDRALVWMRPSLSANTNMLFSIVNSPITTLATVSSNWPALTVGSATNAVSFRIRDSANNGDAGLMADWFKVRAITNSTDTPVALFGEESSVFYGDNSTLTLGTDEITINNPLALARLKWSPTESLTVATEGLMGSHEDFWASGANGLKWNDGTRAVTLVPMLSSSTPTNGQILVYNESGYFEAANNEGSSGEATNVAPTALLATNAPSVGAAYHSLTDGTNGYWAVPAGAGDVVLDGENVFTGDTNLFQGVVQVGNHNFLIPDSESRWHLGIIFDADDAFYILGGQPGSLSGNPGDFSLMSGRVDSLVVTNTVEAASFVGAFYGTNIIGDVVADNLVGGSLTVETLHTGLTNAAVVGTDGDGRLVAGNVTNLFSGTTVNLGSIYSITSATNIYLTAVTAPAAGTYGFWQLTVNATAGITLTNMPTILASDFLKTRTITNGNRATISIEVQPGVYTNMSIVQFR